MAPDDSAPDDPAENDAGAGRQRLDRWLWCARFFKSRSLAATFCHKGGVRLSGRKIDKAHQAVRCGDVLTFPLGPHIRVVRIAKLASRRGPPAEARTLYEDLAPPQPRVPEPATPAVAQRDAGSGRPSKAERRATDRLKAFDDVNE